MRKYIVDEQFLLDYKKLIAYCDHTKSCNYPRTEFIESCTCGLSELIRQLQNEEPDMTKNYFNVKMF